MSRKRKKAPAAAPQGRPNTHTASPTPVPGPSSSPLNPFHLVFLILISLVLYAPTLRNDFVTDDRAQILQNSLVLEAKNLGLAFTGDVWAFARSARESAVHVGTNYYRPLQPVIYTVEYHLWGAHPLPWHLFSTLLNVGVVALIYLLVASLEGAPLAFWTALCFALHPMHCEPVAWIAALPELLCAFFLLLAMWLYCHAGSAPAAPMRHLLLGAFFFLCALFSKEPALLFPLILVCYEYFYHRPQLADLRHIATRLLPYLIVLGIYLAARISALGGFSPRQIMDRPRLSVAELFFTVPALFARYVGKLLLPIDMNYFYAFPLTSTFTVWAFAGSVAGLLLVAAALFFRKRQPIHSFALCWFLFTLLPALSVNSLALNFFTERYLYIPSVGFAILAASAGLLAYSRASSPLSRLALASTFTVLLVFYTVQIERRLPIFHDNYTLLSDTVRKSPNSYLAQAQYAYALYDRHDLDGALEHVLVSLQINPSYVLGQMNAALYLSEKGDYEDAIFHQKEAIRLYPDYVPFWLNLAKIYTLQHDWKTAAETYRHASTLDPTQQTYLLHLAGLADTNANSQAALASLQSDADTKPGDFDASVRLGDEAFLAGQWPRAAQAFQHAAELRPSNALVIGKWGIALQRAGNLTQAIEVLQHALQLQPGQLLLRQSLASVFANSNRLDESNAELRKILAANPNWEHADQVHLALGVNLEKSRDSTAAIQEYTRALALNPSLQLASQRLAALRSR